MWPFKSAKPEPPTLKTHVTEFWKWFSTNADRFYTTIEVGRCPDLTDEVCEGVDRWLSGMAWVFGPGVDRVGHSFTLSGEGDLTKQFVAEYWLSRAPKLDGWIFYSARQPSDSPHPLTLDGVDQRFDPAELWIATTPNEQTEKLDIMAWHPLFPQMEERRRWIVFFLLLDEVLGEHGTQNWIGEIVIGDTRLKDAIPVFELRDLVDRIARERQWKKGNPTTVGFTYQRKDLDESKLRGDIFIGGTRHFQFVTAYGRSGGPIPHPCPEIGLDFVFVAFHATILPKGSEVAFRSEIEDALADALKSDLAGDTLGGATGTRRVYIEVMLFDGQRSLNAIRATLKRLRIPGGASIHRFTTETACPFDLN